MAGWSIKQEPTICCLQETYFRAKDTHILKVRDWKKTLHANGILISDRMDSKTKAIKKRRIPYNDMSQYKKRI